MSGRPVGSGLVVKKLKKSSRCLKTAGAAAFRLLAAFGGADELTQSRRISRRLVTATVYYTCKPEKEIQRGSSRLFACHYMMSSYLVKECECRRRTDDGGRKIKDERHSREGRRHSSECGSPGRKVLDSRFRGNDSLRTDFSVRQRWRSLRSRVTLLGVPEAGTKRRRRMRFRILVCCLHKSSCSTTL